MDETVGSFVSRSGYDRGGGINGSFFAAGLVDEPSVIVAPALDAGTGARGIVEAGEAGLSGRASLSLTACERLEHGLVHLRYAVRTA